MDRHDKIDIVIAAIMVCSLVLSIYSYDIARQANDITYNYYLPDIKPMQIIKYDKNADKYYGEIDIYNGGGRVRDFRPTLYTIGTISYSNYQKNTNIMFYGYYNYPGEESQNFEGLLWKYNIDDGYMQFNNISSEFGTSARGNYSDASLTLAIILRATYQDFYGKYHAEYFNVTTGTRLGAETGMKIDEATKNYNSAQKLGLSMSLSDLNLDGTKLFQFWNSNLKE
jgi:hypothetical protein